MENPNLKGLLRRVLGKIFNDVEIKGWCKEQEQKNAAEHSVEAQIAAAVSNVLVVSTSAYLLDACWRAVTVAPILDLHAAEHVYETLSPVNSGTVIYAALTGVTLWLSSLAGGWIENWAVYHNVPQALAEHSWGVRFFGGERMIRWADRFSRKGSLASRLISAHKKKGTFVPFSC